MNTNLHGFINTQNGVLGLDVYISSMKYLCRSVFICGYTYNLNFGK